MAAEMSLEFQVLFWRVQLWQCQANLMYSFHWEQDPTGGSVRQPGRFSQESLGISQPIREFSRNGGLYRFTASSFMQLVYFPTTIREQCFD